MSEHGESPTEPGKHILVDAATLKHGAWFVKTVLWKTHENISIKIVEKFKRLFKWNKKIYIKSAWIWGRGYLRLVGASLLRTAMSACQHFVPAAILRKPYSCVRRPTSPRTSCATLQLLPSENQENPRWRGLLTSWTTFLLYLWWPISLWVSTKVRRTGEATHFRVIRKSASVRCPRVQNTMTLSHFVDHSACFPLLPGFFHE